MSAGRAAGSGRAPLRWGIVGTGVIAAHFAADLALAGRSRLAAVASRAFENARAFSARFGGTPHDDLGRMLADDAIDAVYVATPNEAHFATAMAVIAAGKAVLVEKPLAVTSQQAEQIAACARAGGVFAMEAMWTRFLPAFAHVRSQVRSGALGTIRSVSGELAFNHPYAAGSRFFDPALGGGSMLDLGVYGISLCLDLFGRPDAAVGSWDPAPSGVDMAAAIDLRFEGMTAHLRCGFDRNGGNLFVVEGSRSTLIVQPPFNAARMVVEARAAVPRSLAAMPGGGMLPRTARKLARSVPLPGLTRHRFDFAGHGLQFEINAVEEALGEGWIESPAAPLADSIDALRIIERVLRPPAER
jgi:predicted dehydrogenase